ncbi:hypothetical protein [Halorubrum sp. HHNYT27]|uniref:hypothetical protein n=1 Tax=Halorubrum sp. HHNYT27 TaxID=3402275 RepID=UPI003EBDFB19
MNSPRSRRRLLAATIPALLAGCLVESGEGGEEGTSGAPDDEPDDADDGESDAEGERTAESEETADADDSTAEQTDAEQTDEEPVPDSVGPDGSGLVITNVDVLDVSDDGSETTVEARLVVENRGRFSYGTVEFRVDAYATRPNSPERTAVGRGYVTRRFLLDDRFDDGARRFETSITFRSSESNVPANTDWYAVDVAVRRAEPV